MDASQVPGPADAVAAGDLGVAERARVELDRIARRWRELPLGAAQAGMPLVRAVVVDLAARTGSATGPAGTTGPAVPPDLGPGVVMDQLAVLVWDAYAAGVGDGIPETLAAVRRELG